MTPTSPDPIAPHRQPFTAAATTRMKVSTGAAGEVLRRSQRSAPIEVLVAADDRDARRNQIAEGPRCVAGVTLRLCTGQKLVLERCSRASSATTGRGARLRQGEAPRHRQPEGHAYGAAGLWRYCRRAGSPQDSRRAKLVTGGASRGPTSSWPQQRRDRLRSRAHRCADQNTGRHGLVLGTTAGRRLCGGDPPGRGAAPRPAPTTMARRRARCRPT